MKRQRTSLKGDPFFMATCSSNHFSRWAGSVFSTLTCPFVAARFWGAAARRPARTATTVKATI